MHLSGDGRPRTRSSLSPGAAGHPDAAAPHGACRLPPSSEGQPRARGGRAEPSRVGRTLQPPGVPLPPRPLPSRLSFFPFVFAGFFGLNGTFSERIKYQEGNDCAFRLRVCRQEKKKERKYKRPRPQLLSGTLVPAWVNGHKSWFAYFVTVCEISSPFLLSESAKKQKKKNLVSPVPFSCEVSVVTWE